MICPLFNLSRKVSFVVFQSISQITNTEEISFFLDIDESEKEEKSELDESEKMQQKLYTTFTFSYPESTKQYTHILVNYKVLHQEYTTPPPEIG